MKILIIIFSMFLCANAVAEWEEFFVFNDGKGSAYIDTDTVRIKDNKVKAWLLMGA